MAYFRYVLFLGPHTGSLQPCCLPQQPRVPHPTKAITYSLALSDFKTTIARAGHPGELFAEHSNKRGGATHAANCGVPGDEIREMGQWKSLQTAQLYVDENTPTKQRRNHLLQGCM